MHLFEIFEKYFDTFFRSTRSNRFKVSEHRNYWKRFNQIYQHASFRTRRETLLPTVASIESIIIETKLWSVLWRRGLLEEDNQCDIVIMNGKLVLIATYLDWVWGCIHNYWQPYTNYTMVYQSKASDFVSPASISTLRFNSNLAFIWLIEGVLAYNQPHYDY